MKTLNFATYRGMLSLAAAALLFLLACHITKNEDTEEVFTFPNIAGSLQGSDTARIVLKEPGGRVIDTLYDGPVNGASFTNLVAPNYRGGKVVVSIEGIKGGEVVYKVDKVYSGTSGVVDTTIVIISGPIPKVPADSLVISPSSMVLRAKGAEGNLQAKVYPDTFSQAVLWSSLDPSVAAVSLQGSVSGLDSGIARIVATSLADPKAADTLKVQVLPQLRVETVAFDRASLDLYAEGAAEVLIVTVLPLGANPKVRFSIEDPAFASIQDGKVRGLKEGQTRVFAKSEEDTTKGASMKVVIHPKPAAAVDSVAVAPDTLRLFTGGESITLTAAIYPAVHEARFAWQSAAPAIATVDGSGKVTPVSAGRVFVRARSLVDSTKGDSAVVLVRKDTPRIDVGGDTTISLNGTLVFNPKVTQDYGTLILARWDLDDSGSWDDSGSAFKPVSRTYSTAKEYTVRFYAKDSEGNDTTVSKKVRVVNGPVILIQSPADGSYTNLNPITVTWTVDGVSQTSQETLKAGPNSISRSAKNAAGETFSASVTVHLDLDPPAKPLVKGAAGPISTLRPAWTWESTGGGNGSFRHRLDIDNLATGATATTDTAFTPPANLTAGSHTLFVQERDAAGNWSVSGSFTVRIDTTPPAPPAVTLVTATPTNNRLPSWTWSGVPSEGTPSFRYKLDNNDFRTGATVTALAQFTPLAGSELSEGPHTLYVQQSDSAGNWSASGSAAVRVDITAPQAPDVTAPASPTNDRTPTWTFLPQGGGNGTYRYKLNDRNLAAGATETPTPGYTPTSDLAAGTWVLHVQERDSAGNWSASDSAAVTIDLSSSGAPTVNITGGTPSNDQTPRWTWRQASGGNGNFRYKFNDSNLNAGATETRDTLYDHQAALAAGTYTLYVQQQNAAGNWSSSGSREVRIDTTRPAAPTVTTTQSSPTSERRPTWNWNHSEPGVGAYRYSLDNAPYRDTTSTTFRPGANLSEGAHTLRVLERDSAGNWSDPGSATVSLDITPPNAPIMNLTQPLSPVGSARPTWRWSSGGNGGSGQFRFRLDNLPYSAWGPETLYQPPSQSEGEHTLYVQERDALGNESPEASRKLTITFVGPLGMIGYTPRAYRISSQFSQSGILNVAHSTETGASVESFSNVWSKLGNADYANISPLRNALAMSRDTVFVAYLDGSGSSIRVWVKKFSAGTWQTVGTLPIDSSSYTFIALGIDRNGNPHVGYINDFARVKIARLNRTQNRWENVGASDVGGSADDAPSISIAFNSNNELHVAYTDYETPGLFGSPHIKRWTGSAWQSVTSYPDYCRNVYLRFLGNVPYFAFDDDSKAKYIRFNSSWNPLEELDSETGSDFDFALSSDGIPYISYRNLEEFGSNITVISARDGKLVKVGSSRGTSNSGYGTSLSISLLGVPHVTIVDQSMNEGLSTFKYGFDP